MNIKKILFMFKFMFAFTLSVFICLFAVAPAYAAVFSENLLKLDEVTISNTLNAKGYSVQPETKDFNYKATYKDRSNDFLDGSFTLCKGKTISVVIGIDENTEYDDQLKSLLKRYGQPTVSVQKAELRDGDITYVDLEWEANGHRINLQNYPPSKFWKVPTTRRIALLTFLDLEQKCYFVPPRMKKSD